MDITSTDLLDMGNRERGRLGKGISQSRRSMIGGIGASERRKTKEES